MQWEVEMWVDDASKPVSRQPRTDESCMPRNVSLLHSIYYVPRKVAPHTFPQVILWVQNWFSPESLVAKKGLWAVSLPPCSIVFHNLASQVCSLQLINTRVILELSELSFQHNTHKWKLLFFYWLIRLPENQRLYTAEFLFWWRVMCWRTFFN